MIKNIFVLLLAITILYTGTASADSFLDVEIKSDSSSISFNWNDISDNYRFYLLDNEGNERYLWSGETTSYTHGGLKVNTPYKYKLYIYNDNGEQVESVIITSRTLKTEKNIANTQIPNIKKMGKESELLTNENILEKESEVFFPMSDSSVNAVYNDTYLTLSWDRIPTENNEYKVYKDGAFLTTVKGFEYVDYDIKQNEVYKYSIVGNKKLPYEEIERRTKEITDTLGRSLSEEEEKSIFTEMKTASLIIRISKESVFKEELKTMTSLNKNISSANFTPPGGRNIMLRYTTFIPEDYPANPWPDLLSKYKYFGGDDRSFDADSSKFRTRLDTYSTWSQNFTPQGVTANPQTGVTKGYDQNKKLIGTGQADAIADHKIWMEEIGDYQEDGENWIYHRGSVSSKIPLLTQVATPAIDAFYYAKIWYDGRGEFYGVHDQAPSHEVYLKYGGTWITVHQSEHVDFDYLFPIATKNEWQVYID